MAIKTVIDTNVLVSETVASNFLLALKEGPNVFFTHVYYKWNLISDADDNKFVDCYIVAGAEFLITHDHHFSILKTLPFPKVNVDEFAVQMSAAR